MIAGTKWQYFTDRHVKTNTIYLLLHAILETRQVSMEQQCITFNLKLVFR